MEGKKKKKEREMVWTGEDYFIRNGQCGIGANMEKEKVECRVCKLRTSADSMKQVVEMGLLMPIL